MNHHNDSHSGLMAIHKSEQSKSSSTLNSAIAGYIAGVSGTVIGYPLDSAKKVWLQTNSVGQNKHMRSYQVQQQQHHHHRAALHDTESLIVSWLVSKIQQVKDFVLRP
jgi:hypothetical protein